ncbi:MAG: hypothetical protein H6Q26_1004 [Bacteroidetes bacterium]|uniref:hypothetical protein n=1 Tax=Chitinophaga sp. LS1 TaxID=3051176 RepID=UPI001D6879B9|nr:hypothetical protein [Chitinophaga sp. LS1]MBP1650847.1 hypothetical protein [Bacteroidota bacterium]WPV64795.1 hypothetical protein QQL36_23620 [Chitinophaga sp. LS1]
MKYTFILLLSAVLFACTSTSTGVHVIYLDKLDHKAEVEVNGQYGPGYYRYALIENAPNSADSLKQIIHQYCDSAVNKTDVEAHYIRYFIQFYRLSKNTKSYMKGKEDYWDIHNDINQELEDYKGEYRFERCSTDSLHGVWTMEVNGKTDTLENKCTQ